MTKTMTKVVPLLGVFGFFLSLFGLCWQVFVYRQGTAERALVRTTALRKSEDGETFSPVGHVAVEVVNIGQKPLFVSRVLLTLGSDVWRLEEPEEFKQSRAAIEPGAAATYWYQNWNFVEHPLDFAPSPEGNKGFAIIVESNRGEIARRTQIDDISIYAAERQMTFHTVGKVRSGAHFPRKPPTHVASPAPK